MAWRRSTVYAVRMSCGHILFEFSPRPAVDAAWHRRRGAKYIVPIQPTLPPPWAEEACRHLQRQADGPVRAVRRATPATAHGRVSAAVRRFWRGLGLRPLAEGGGVAAGSGLGVETGAEGRAGAEAGSEAGAEAEASSASKFEAEDFLAVVAAMIARTRRHLAFQGFRWDARAGDVVRLQPDKLAGGEPGRPEADEDVDGGWSLEADGEFRWPAAEEMEAVARLIEGRLLTELEILQWVERSGLEPESPVEDCLAALTKIGAVTRRPGLRRIVLGGWRCQRCGETDEIVLSDCAACGESECAECEACRGLGVLRACTLLYAGRVTERAAEEALGPRAVAFRSPQLTPVQARAAERLRHFATDAGEPQEALVWAVCGAGKTELCFPAVAECLGRGGRVLFAIPRRDIVRELGRRLRRAFPEIETQVLHGGDGRIERLGLGPGTLTVATTHQLLRFERAFDLVIVDEVDAFPYRSSPMLKQAVRRAMRSGGRLVHMSATPERRLVGRADEGKLQLITVPVRHHGRPLPVPQLHRVAGLERMRGRSLAYVVGLIDASLEGKGQGVPEATGPADLAQAPDPARVIVFVPDVASTEKVGRMLAQAYGGQRRVLWSYAGDPARDAKLRALRAGDCDVFVATTILERGVTVPDVDVVVLFADEERVFNEATLVQMAGRVGRSAARPAGRVHFVGGRVTAEMRGAVDHIERMNGEARRLGLLRDV